VVVRPTSKHQDRVADGSTSAAQMAAVAPLSVTAELYRRTADGEERLLPGARVAPGDGLFMEVQSADSVHVYVLNEDAEGEVYALFPGPSFDQRNPLAGGATHRLPGTTRGRSVSWEVTSAGGREHVIVLASRKPLPDVEREIAALPTATVGRPVSYARLSGRTVTLLRGIGGVRVDPSATAPAKSRLSDLLGSLSEGSSARGDVWAWQFELENPKR
jgi:hypothetical protein